MAGVRVLQHSDLEPPDCRDNYVACGMNTYDDFASVAATQPFEAKLMLQSQRALEKTRGGKPLMLCVANAKRACPNGRPNRSLRIRRPNEFGLASQTVGRIETCCYGTRARSPSGRLCMPKP